jgi:uncharacterized membrane protein
VTSFLLDIVHLVTGRTQFAQTAFWIMGIGIASGISAVVFDLMDWSFAPGGTNAWKIGIAHSCACVLTVSIFGASWSLRYPDPTTPSRAALALCVLGAATAIAAGCLGSLMVRQLVVGIDGTSDLEAPGPNSPEMRWQKHKRSSGRTSPDDSALAFDSMHGGTKALSDPSGSHQWRGEGHPYRRT